MPYQSLLPDPEIPPGRQPRRYSLWTAHTGAAVGFFVGLPLAALVTRTVFGEPSAVWTLLVWPAFPLAFAMTFGAVAHVRERGSGWRLSGFRFEERHRAGLAWSLILLSPVLAALIAASAVWLSFRGFMPAAIDVVTPFVALATSPLAAIGPASGALLLRLPIVGRVMLGMTLGFVGFVAFWIVDDWMMWLLGFF